MKKIWMSIALAVCGLSSVAFGEAVRGTGEKAPDGYVPPLLANGDVSLTLDYSGGMRNRGWSHVQPAVYRAGRRGPLPKTELLEEGKLNPVLVVDGEAQGWPQTWSQTLEPRTACTRIQATYAKGVTMRTEAFVCEGLPVFAVRRSVAAGDLSVKVKIGDSFAGPFGKRVRGAQHDAARDDRREAADRARRAVRLEGLRLPPARVRWRVGGVRGEGRTGSQEGDSGFPTRGGRFQCADSVSANVLWREVDVLR